VGIAINQVWREPESTQERNVPGANWEVRSSLASGSQEGNHAQLVNSIFCLLCLGSGLQPHKCWKGAVTLS
jgi:hypothetical protein